MGWATSYSRCARRPYLSMYVKYLRHLTRNGRQLHHRRRTRTTVSASTGGACERRRGWNRCRHAVRHLGARRVRSYLTRPPAAPDCPRLHVQPPHERAELATTDPRRRPPAPARPRPDNGLRVDPLRALRPRAGSPAARGHPLHDLERPLGALQHLCVPLLPLPVGRPLLHGKLRRPAAAAPAHACRRSTATSWLASWSASSRCTAAARCVATSPCWPRRSRTAETALVNKRPHALSPAIRT